MANDTPCHSFNGTRACFYSTTPWYYSPKPSLIDGFSDHYLSLLMPVIAYWAMSLFFHFLDVSRWKWLERYRMHDSAAVQARNLVTRSQVIFAVLFQQAVQTILGLVSLSDDSDERTRDHSSQMLAIALRLYPGLSQVFGNHSAVKAIPDVVYYVYWWGIPAFQFAFGMFVIDTWQYFLHRLMHVNKFMYRHFHSWHHRLYVPYAFGALYNHPIEGFILDSSSAIMAQLLAGMTVRQAALLFVLSTLKTVDDHCGYSLPFDPLQLITSNNADYHDIHHQVIGIKSNFAQPFFVHWDALLGTRMTRKEVDLRRKKEENKND